MTITCFTIGYQERNIEDLCAAVFDAGVDLLVDVRERAWSHRPEFRKQALEAALGEWGIGYIHLREAGNPFRPGNGVTGGFEACAVRYEEYLREHPNLLKKVSALVEESEVAFFCYERESSACHRSILVNELLSHLPALRVQDL